MSNTPSAGPEHDRSTDMLTRAAVDRRSFLRYTGATAVVGGLLLAGCKKDDDDPTPVTPPVTLTKTLTNDDFGILNYAYALEQLEAAFYTKVVSDSGSALSVAEMDIMKAIKDHEIIHREFFKAALGAKRLIDLTPNFSTINFTNRDSVLGAARLFEDTGVKAYNGAGRYITNADYLVLAGKIVSVEARHAALLRDMIVPNSFAANVQMGTVPAALNAQGLDVSLKPSQILPLVAPYIQEAAQLVNMLP